jgi:hypothetical protein
MNEYYVNKNDIFIHILFKIGNLYIENSPTSARYCVLQFSDHEHFPNLM